MINVDREVPVHLGYPGGNTSVRLGQGRFRRGGLGVFFEADVDPGVGRAGEVGQGIELSEAEQGRITRIGAGGLLAGPQGIDRGIDLKKWTGNFTRPMTRSSSALIATLLAGREGWMFEV